MSSINKINGPKPDHYFASRILALHASQLKSRELSFWRLLTTFTTAVVFILSFLLIQKNNSSVELSYTLAPVLKPMVLQINDSTVPKDVFYISLEIDEDMIFDLGPTDFPNKKEITLAFENTLSGTRRLPFVFKALTAGKKKIKIKFLDLDLNVVKEDQHILEFFETQKKGIKI